MKAPLEVAQERRLPIGAEVLRHKDGVHFRVWAPAHASVHLVLEDASGTPYAEFPMAVETHGYFSVRAPGAHAGTRYRYRLGSGSDRLPDPASRFQPDGPHGASEVVDCSVFSWSDAGWRGLTLAGQVLYEMHIGTFSSEGTWNAAAERLSWLRELGITALEVMPVAEFPGRFGWGYDGVDLFAPSHLYGRPDDFRQFVDRAHALGLGVILDVVYNHVGPDGNVLGLFSPRYFSTRYENEWGQAMNFDDDAAPVRALIVSNARYWIQEFHLDGLRFDATQQMFDASEEHVLTEIARTARAAAGRPILLVAENERQQTHLLRSSDEGGCGLDALWNDDFHHNAVVALTGRREAYYTDYGGTPQECLSLAKWGFLYQGQRYSWQMARRGTPAFGLTPSRFITFLENHDQVANALSGGGERLHQLASPATLRAMTAFWLLSPGTPMFFQGQEFNASSPFVFFADHGGALGEAVRKGRTELMRQFRSVAASDDLHERWPAPSDPDMFRRSVLNDAERDTHQRAVQLHRDLLRLRHQDPVLGTDAAFFEGAVLGAHAFVLRFFLRDPRLSMSGADDRLLLVNLGADIHLDPAPEPLLAPPSGMEWEIRWSSEAPAYGGGGTPPLDTDDNWQIPGHAAVLLAPRAL